MTQKSIDRQIEAIRKATAEASVSKEAAIAFLTSAGIKETPKIVDRQLHSTTKKVK